MRLWQRGKRGTWWIDVTISGQRITRSTGTTSKPQAEEYAALLASDTWRTRRLGEKPRITFGQAVLDWLAKHRDDRRSIEDMKDRLRWLCGHLGATPLAGVTPALLDTLLATKDASNATRNRYVAEASKILNHAHRQGWLDAVPALRHYHEPRADPRWLTQDQADILIAELPDHLADMAEFSLATGLRESNVRLLRWSQVDLPRCVAWVLSGQAKNKRALSVPLNVDACDVLARRRGLHPIYVFTYEHNDGTRKPVWNCSNHAWYKAIKRAKVAGFRWHDLRHTWATWHVISGTPLPVLMQLGGWSSLDMVMRYAHVAAAYTAQYAGGSLRDKSVTTSEDAATESPQAIDMILRGMFPSQGWRIGERTEMREGSMYFECFPIPPK